MGRIHIHHEDDAPKREARDAIGIERVYVEVEKEIERIIEVEKPIEKIVERVMRVEVPVEKIVEKHVHHEAPQVDLSGIHQHISNHEQQIQGLQAHVDRVYGSIYKELEMQRQALVAVKNQRDIDRSRRLMLLNRLKKQRDEQKKQNLQMKLAVGASILLSIIALCIK